MTFKIHQKLIGCYLKRGILVIGYLSLHLDSFLHYYKVLRKSTKNLMSFLWTFLIFAGN